MINFPSFLRRVARCAAVSAVATAGLAQAAPTYGPELEGFTYPYPLQHLPFRSQQQAMQMAYMDVPAAGKVNGKTVVLLHGKNFCAATWETSIDALSRAGYRVIVPDQIGFCASSKPERYQYSFQQLAANTRALLQRLGLQQTTIVGHSTGGMLATRYALMYPQAVDRLVLVNPIGLEDWKALGVPARTVDQWFEREDKLSAESVRQYEQAVYYGGRWKPEYDRWVDMLAGLSQGAGHRLVAWNTALVDDMIFTQPVVYEFPLLKVPTVLMIGDADTTAIGVDLAPPEVRAQLGRYGVLGGETVKRIPNARLVQFPGLGHAPQIEAPALFNKSLLGVLDAPL